MLSLFLALVLCVAPQDGAEEQYRFLAGLYERGLYDRAAREARDFLAQHPRDARADLVRYRLAGALFELERVAEALPEYEALTRVADFEYADEAWLRVGEARLRLGAPREAREAFARALGGRQTYLYPAARFLLGEAELALERWAAARQAYTATLADESAREYHAHARRGLAWCALREDDAEAAARHATRFLAEAPEHELADEVRYVLGEAEHRRGRLDAAEAAWRAVAAGPQRAAALRGRAYLAAERGDARGAAALFGELLALEPAGPAAREAALQRGAQLVRAGDSRAALAALDHAALARDPEAALWRARALAADGDARAALAQLDAAAAAAQGELAAQIASAQGDLLLELGELDAATRAYGRADSDYALHASATGLLAAGDAPRAEAAARAHLERFPASPYRATVALVLAEALFAREAWDAARAAFDDVARLPGLDAATAARVAARRAWCDYRAGRLDEAARGFADVRARFPDDPHGDEARELEGRARLELGDEAGAAAAWRRFLDEFPASPRRWEVELGLARLAPDDARLAALARGEAPADVRARALFAWSERRDAAGDAAGAIEVLGALLRDHAAHALAPRARYALAWDLHALGRSAEALAQLEPVCAPDAPPELARPACELAVWAAAATGDAAAVERAWRRFARLEEGADARLAALRTATRALAQAGRGALAERLLAEELARAGSRAVAPALEVERAWVALDAGRAADAATRAEAALALAPDDAAALEACFFAADALLAAEDDARAEACFTRVAGTDGALADDALYRLGFAHLARADAEPARLAQAAQAFAELARRFPRSELVGEALWLAGECAWRAGDPAAALPWLERVRREHRGHDARPKALFRLGQCALATGDAARAVDALQELLGSAPDFEAAVEARLVLGRALAAQGQARGARAAFDAVLAADQGVFAARARLELGRLELAAGRHEDALSHFLKVALLYAYDDEVAEATLLAGRCLEAQGERALARDQYERVVREHADSRHAAAARERLAALRTE